MNSDDMHADPLLLASAYLDGELTADERATAEADPAVMAEVEVLRALRDGVRDVEPPSVEAREAAIAAAMAEFGAATAPTPPTPAPAREAPRVAPVPFRRRPTWYGPALGIAAAVVAIGLFGLVITQAGGGDDDDAADDAGMTEETAGAPEFERDSAEAADAGGEAADEATGDMAAELAEDGGEDIAGADTAEMSEAAGAEPTADAEDTGDDASAEETGGTDLGELPIATTGFTPDRPITTPSELAAFGRDLVGRRDDGVLGPTPETRCPTQVVLGTAWYETAGIVEEVLIAVDPPLEFVIAVDATSCDELELVELTLVG